MKKFNYNIAFSRNIGWITDWEQEILKNKKVAIAGMGGVGGAHLLTLVRIGISNFNIADFDSFQLVNFNRQVGANNKTINKQKINIMVDMAKKINPFVNITLFEKGINNNNIISFLEDTDLYVDGLDFFVPDIRSKVFSKANELNIPAITAAPLGFGAAYIVFMPNKMTFEEYFQFNNDPKEKKYIKFLLGLAPKSLQSSYLIDKSKINLSQKKGPSSITACNLCAGITGVEAIKILLNRGKVFYAPWYHQFDVYKNKFIKKQLFLGNKNPIQKTKIYLADKLYTELNTKSYSSLVSSKKSIIHKILDIAKWAPSGDNSQPWSFKIINKHKFKIIIKKSNNIYNYNDNQPTFLSIGCLLENISIAASNYKKNIKWQYFDDKVSPYIIVTLIKNNNINIDPLFSSITLRSVNRFPYKLTKLNKLEKIKLQNEIGKELDIVWFNNVLKKINLSLFNGLSTSIRLNIKETYDVHKKIIDWKNNQSNTGIPTKALGLSTPSLKILKYIMKSYKLSNIINKIPGTMLISKLQLDYIPGMFCSDHFIIFYKNKKQYLDKVDIIKAGCKIQRFWLRATSLGLSIQPSLSPLCFSYYGQKSTTVTKQKYFNKKTKQLNKKFIKLFDNKNVLFFGRIGVPKTKNIFFRSWRKSINSLMIS